MTVFEMLRRMPKSNSTSRNLFQWRHWMISAVFLFAILGGADSQANDYDEAIIIEGNTLFSIAVGWNNGEDLVDPDFGLLKTWNGESACDFKGVTCAEDGHVLMINLQGFKIYGTVDPDFNVFSRLETLILANNNFYGLLPDSLLDLQYLSELDVSSNNFTSDVPAFLSQMPNLTLANSLNLANNKFESIPANVSIKFCYPQFAGNPAVANLSSAAINATFPRPCVDVYVAPPPSEDGVNVAALVGGIVGGVALLLIVLTLLFVYWLHHRHPQQVFQKLSQQDMDDIEAGFSGTSLARIQRFTLADLVAATENFNEKNKLGEGGYATVFKGTISGAPVAVKRLKTTRGVGRAEMLEFMNEIDTISRAVHRHVLKLEGYCIEGGERIMVFPFMPHGSVRDHLQGRPSGVPPLSLDLRRQIAICAAQGLSYLHDDCETRIIHRDVKAANVLLTDKYEGVVADFGLAKLVNYEDTHVTTAVRGTFGHIAPEYVLSGQTSEKSDVYSFGVFLLEVITGKDAVTLSQSPEARSGGLKAWFSSSFQDGRLVHIIDIELRMIDIDVLEGEYQTEVLEDMVQVALLCLADDPKLRPTMADVARLLQGDGLEAAWELWEKQQGDITEEQHSLEGGGAQGYSSAASIHSGTSAGNTTDVSMVGYNLSGPR